MTWIDISVPLEAGMITWPNDPPFGSERLRSIAAGAHANVSHLSMGAHAGTHIDAPCHFIDGAAAVEATPLDAVIGPAFVVDATQASGALDAAAVAALAIPDGETRVLFKTRNGGLRDDRRWDAGFVALDHGGAAAIVDRGVRLVGLDFLSIARFDDPVATHQALLGAGVVVLEGLDLRTVEPGPYELICLPLRVVGSDGGPARAVLRPREN